MRLPCKGSRRAFTLEQHPLPIVLSGSFWGSAWRGARRFIFGARRVAANEVGIVVRGAIDRCRDLISFEQVFRSRGNQRGGSFGIDVGAIEPQIESVG